MKYSEEFKKELKEVYPNDTNLHEMAECGDVFLGRYLDDMSGGSVPLDDILTSISLDDLQKRARLLKRRLALYRKWGEEYDNSRK